MGKAKKYNYERTFNITRFFEHHFADNSIYNAASLFLEEKKLIVNGNYQSKCGAINQYKKIIRIFFSKIQIEEITREYILRKLREKQGPWTIRLHFMWEFLFFLKDSGVLFEEWEQIEHLRARLCSNPNGNFSKAVLSVADSSRYRLLKFGKNIHLCYLDSGNPDIQELMVDFLTKQDCYDDSDHIFSFLFETQKICPNVVEDINYEMFCRQVRLIGENANRKKYLSQVIAFFRFIYVNYNPNLFSETVEFDARLLLRNGLAGDLIDGYRIVPYNPLGSYPKHNRWIISFYPFNEQYSKNITLTRKVDFTKVKSEKYRDYLKEYLWSYPCPWKTKLETERRIMYFLNYVSGVKAGEIPTIFTKKTDDETFSVAEMAAYRQHIVWKYPNIKTQGHYLGDASAFLKHLLDLGVTDFEKGVLEHMKVCLAANTDKEPIPDEDLKRIATVMSKNAKGSLKSFLYYSVFYLALETEFRISQLVNLEADCVQETVKKSQYIISNKTKNSSGEYKEQAITLYTKKHLDEIKRLTESFRKSCPDERMNRLLFLELYNEKCNLFRPLSAESFNKHLKKCCAEAGTKTYTYSNLRDTHMTKAEEFIIRKGLSDMYLKVLTDHKSSETTRRHYANAELTEMLEAVYGIIIGDIHLEGTVLPESAISFPETETVSNRCGYCRNSVCTTQTYLDCLMCCHFITTPDRIPYFEEQIKMLDYKIKEIAIIPHDREDLVAIKRLLTAYLREMLLVKEDAKDASFS